MSSLFLYSPLSLVLYFIPSISSSFSPFSVLRVFPSFSFALFSSSLLHSLLSPPSPPSLPPRLRFDDSRVPFLTSFFFTFIIHASLERVLLRLAWTGFGTCLCLRFELLSFPVFPSAMLFCASESVVHYDLPVMLRQTQKFSLIPFWSVFSFVCFESFVHYSSPVTL